MSSELPQRELLASYLIQRLTAAFQQLAAPPLVGDALAPPKAGYARQPGASDFTTYCTLTGLAGRKQPRQGLGDNNQSWVIGFRVESFGAAREQADYVADRAAEVLINLGPRNNTDERVAGSFAIQQVECTSLGGPNRNDQVSPAEWSRIDTFDVWLARGRDRARTAR